MPLYTARVPQPSHRGLGFKLDPDRAYRLCEEPVHPCPMPKKFETDWNGLGRISKFMITGSCRKHHYLPSMTTTHPDSVTARKKDMFRSSHALQAYCSSTSFSPSKALKPSCIASASASPRSSLYLKFRATYHENVRYLKAIGVVDPNTKPHKLPSPDAITQMLATVDFFKSKGFSDADFARLAFFCPQLFSLDHFDLNDIEPVFQFLASEVLASGQESRGLVTQCPQLLFSDVEYCLRPTLNYLKKLGLEKLNVPSSLNAHLLNTRVEKLRTKVKFLKSIGFSYEEAARACARLPAIFGYSVDNNLRPKFEYLMEEMGRSLEELKEFPQYFGFSLHKRIVPRHLHLKARNVRIKLNRMLLWSDQRFYAKWK